MQPVSEGLSDSHAVLHRQIAKASASQVQGQVDHWGTGRRRRRRLTRRHGVARCWCLHKATWLSHAGDLEVIQMCMLQSLLTSWRGSCEAGLGGSESIVLSILHAATGPQKQQEELLLLVDKRLPSLSPCCSGKQVLERCSLVPRRALMTGEALGTAH